MAEKWEPYELQFLREVAGQMSGLIISEKLERTHAAIKTMARKKGISLCVQPKNKDPQ
ncbi:hypothetical protein [Serratia sp. UGAL515B_01]|uniref:hypothetical protein n=1 Tax=Serratia sp. UGAL515B_01 TaxID=2986763 RepID=UPI002955C54C|nr:hypothetical protein [Serratia sp. UGAL515B_01]WON77541.1 hypothetical protein OK023_02210 [Serratia sp. UGAL515B_01]